MQDYTYIKVKFLLLAKLFLNIVASENFICSIVLEELSTVAVAVLCTLGQSIHSNTPRQKSPYLLALSMI